MKIQRQWVPAAAIAALSGFGLTTTQENAELEARVLELESRTDAVEAYLAGQAKAAEKLQTALDESEKAGFTFGINPESREILLGAWRAEASTRMANVPGGEAGDDEAAGGRGVLEK